jgi:hypothetical protein
MRPASCLTCQTGLFPSLLSQFRGNGMICLLKTLTPLFFYLFIYSLPNINCTKGFHYISSHAYNILWFYAFIFWLWGHFITHSLSAVLNSFPCWNNLRAHIIYFIEVYHNYHVKFFSQPSIDSHSLYSHCIWWHLNKWILIATKGQKYYVHRPC